MIWMRMIRKCLKWLIYGHSHRWICSLFDMKWPFSSFSLFAQMNNCYKSSYQEVKVGIQLTCLTPKHSCAYFKPMLPTMVHSQVFCTSNKHVTYYGPQSGFTYYNLTTLYPEQTGIWNVFSWKYECKEYFKRLWFKICTRMFWC
jgi:hypothetical protein